MVLISLLIGEIVINQFGPISSPGYSILIYTLWQVGKVSTNFAATKNGKVGSNFSAAKNGQVSSNSKKR